MPTKPPIHELEYLKKTQNHQELNSKLQSLNINASLLSSYSKYICKCWFELADQHLSEASVAVNSGLSRSVYSRSYYAVYNASKAARYLVKGGVSLKGDDHSQASIGLPDNFPDVALWSQRITDLHQHRLRADYDNWFDTNQSHTLTLQQALSFAKEFVSVVRDYVNAKFGAFL